MKQKSNVSNKFDINRRLAVYYHPLFLEIVELFFLLLGSKDKHLNISFIGFIELNLRLQKALIIEFILKDAFMSALNDWLKEVHDCSDLQELYYIEQINIEKELNDLPFVSTLSVEEYEGFMKEFQEHQAFKNLNIRINEEILSKFLFDLATTWCEHLDVELYSQFLIVLFFQISHGEQVEESQFYSLDEITTLPLSYFEQLNTQKQVYQQSKKKNLMYFRAWCQWNYLRMEEVGENVIYKLVELYPDDDRVEKFLNIVVRAIENVNKEITQQQQQGILIQGQQNNQQQQQQQQQQQYITQPSQQESQQQQIQDQLEDNEEIIQPEEFIKKSIETLEQRDKQTITVNCQVKCHLERVEPLPMDLFQLRYIEHDRSYVLEKKIRMPILGASKPIHDLKLKQQMRKQHFSTEKDVSVFYISDPLEQHQLQLQKQQQLQQQLPSTTKKLKQIIKNKTDNRVQKSISFTTTQQILFPDFVQESAQIKKDSWKLNQQYGNDVSVRKRIISKDIPINLPQPSSYRSQVHNTGRTFRQLQDYYNQKVQDTKHLWENVMTQEEMDALKYDEKKFYYILNLLRIKFNYEHRSEYLNQCNLKLCYLSKRDDMGGALSNEDRKRFQERITRILEREKKRRRKKKGYAIRNKSYSIKTKFKNRQMRMQYNEIFIVPLKNQL